ncbi:MAG: hypothetical protein M0R30_08935 [Methanoregula sp.]|jgi:surface carbohydrate biosynthesis protein|uniref:surface carbohydrate biosynthesis protein n=1 Tax=Methanoregula sp. TaxID=2052170 RepID=UPI0025F95BA0|nr:surface carbohydrate biosynthesis protein [Methanoregula sp.]MCK9631757.1 hypothetical protein [Methanoregula sp.]
MIKTTISSRHWLHLHIETKARELHAKALLCCVAAERGWGATLGHVFPMLRMYEVLPPGVIINQNMALGTMDTIKRVRLYGHRMSCWDEEGLIYHEDFYRRRRLDVDTFDAVDYIFAWGKRQSDDICLALNRPSEKIILSGNPRFDLLRPDFRNIFNINIQKIHERYGKIILINTHFGFYNHVVTKNVIDHYIKSKKIKSVEEEVIMRQVLDHHKNLFPHFLHLIPLLSEKFPNHTIIIRPHPSESHVPWIELAKDLKNVKVVYEGNASEWILASEVMIHNNCMTGIEAFLLSKPSISYRPYVDDEIEHPLPNQVSYQAFNEKELLDIMNAIINNVTDFHLDREKQLKFASEYITSIEGKLACDKIMDALDRLDMPESEAIFPFSPTLQDYKILIKNVIKPNIYLNQKFPCLTLDELQDILKEFQQASGRFADVKIIPINPAGGLQNSCYCFYKP